MLRLLALLAIFSLAAACTDTPATDATVDSGTDAGPEIQQDIPVAPLMDASIAD